jgi:ubiquinone biosynthesis protein
MRPETGLETTLTGIENGFARAVRVVGASLDLVTHVLTHVDKLVADVTADSREVAAESQALYAQAMTHAESVREAVRAAPRFTRVIGEVARLVALYRLRGRSAQLDRESAERLYRLCVELRGGVLKVGQFASSRMDLLPAPYVEALSRLQDRVPPVPTEAIVARIEEELGRPLAEIFASFERTPIAAASLAQVHAAVLTDGTPVAVKVQIPGIESILEIDLAALRVIAGLLGDVRPRFDLETTVAELSRAVRKELDYETEADHAAAFAAGFAGDRDVVVPRVHRELSTSRVLVLEHLDGERITDWLDACEARGAQGARERDQLLATLVRAYCAQVLKQGRFQADAHPGNFLVLPGPRLALVDFGCVQVLTPEARRAYAGLAGAILARDSARMANLFAAMGFATRSGDDGSLHELADMVLGAFRPGADLGLLDPRAHIERVLSIARDNPVVHIPQEFVLLGRVLASLGGLLLRYRPRLDLFALIGPYLLVGPEA